MNYILHVLIVINVYILLCVSLNLVLGYTGILSLAQAAFFGIGAYTAGLLTTVCGIPSEWGVVLAVLFTCVFGAILALPSLRLRGDPLVLGTLAFQVAVWGVLNNWRSLTRGPWGIHGIPPMTLIGWDCSSSAAFFALSLLMCVGVSGLVWRLIHSPFGRLLKAIREDEVLCQSLGKSIGAAKVSVFTVSAGIAGLAGGLFAHYISYIDPSSFTVMESVVIISIVVVGGAGSFWGPIAGAIVLVFVPEMLRFVGLPTAIAANVRQMLYGVALIAFMMWRPRGFLGEYAFRSREALE